MSKFVLYAATIAAIGLPSLTIPSHGASDVPAATSTTQAWMPIWALRAAPTVDAGAGTGLSARQAATAA
ncbi:hypothetical protein ACFWP2_38430 [Kitasatospora sp. NPDC058444]|uniref:hypothetical protein n=1 Tax=Kitasatospora sp. NPDC058444 TaxID=3346504 RepID=UPI00365F6FA8